MELAHRWSDRNLTRIELVFTVLIMAVLIGIFSRYSLSIFSKAEESMVNSTVLNINTALYHRAALAVLSGEYEELEKLLSINPMEEMQLIPDVKELDRTMENMSLAQVSGLIVTPSNYDSVVNSADREFMQKGKWYFNDDDQYLVYVISNTEFFTSNIEGLPRIRFRTTLDYNDRNSNGQYESTIDEFQSIKLSAMDSYQWN